MIRYLAEHLYGRNNVIVFPIGNALLGYSKTFRKLYLIYSTGNSQLFYVFIERKHYKILHTSNFTILLYKKYLTFIKYYSILIMDNDIVK